MAPLIILYACAMTAIDEKTKRREKKSKLYVETLVSNHEINKKIKYRKKMCIISEQIWLYRTKISLEKLVDLITERSDLAFQTIF